MTKRIDARWKCAKNTKPSETALIAYKLGRGTAWRMAVGYWSCSHKSWVGIVIGKLDGVFLWRKLPKP